MSRIGLAFSCFFRLLFGKKLPAAAAAYLPDEARALPAPAAPTEKPIEKPIEKAPEKAKPAEKAAALVKPVEVEKPAPKKVDVAAHHREGALALLGLLQREGRLVDFLRESIEGYGDADIGAAARDIHRGCKKVVDDHFKLEAVMPGQEDDKVQVPKGFDPSEIRIIGEAKGEPPFTGVLRHHGWRAIEATLPTLAEGVDRAVVAPAEVELGR
jgi:hypothetical protein